MKLYNLDYLLQYARQYSPYYGELYKNLPEKLTSLEQVPVIHHAEFWNANTSGNDNRVLTAPFKDGIAFKSGGTTSAPKFSVFSKDEYATFCELTGQAMLHNGIKTGDRFANLFYGGQMYASFLYAHDWIRACPISMIEYPIMGSIPITDIIHIIEQHRTNVLAGVPTTIVSIFQYAHEHKVDLSFVERIYFGGETFFPDQRKFVQSICPGVSIRSSCYALVDGGLVGFCDDTCDFNEHRVFDYAVIVEIIDEETGEVLHETGREGELVVTTLYRTLQPMIRYPLGDRGVWIEPEGASNRKFKLLGRAEAGARIGPISLYYEDIRSIFVPIHGVDILSYQLIITHEDGKDKLTVRVATDNVAKAQAHAADYLAALYKERPMMQSEVKIGHIHAPEFVFGDNSILASNARTGKTKRIIDERIAVN
ncbi:phenylacetate-coenzyme A ligase [Bacteroidia bacterium]|nr:phenylacetate-coenzyme A ligase [Bacteroidia bacterium]